ncbi:betaine-aldehyde dehydrogenase [Micractinium conductrix]|uniref:Betaine-aldehyde dehydrogenase n=1 Tax=Micractinium conductrix TaxID=554055 RepID=A0A2P6VEP1_9CHLO|nr:betaine-aldehyde dehydrogenase [Micractinium conductrix]|eukprot:PSC72541.1 betaine-aldehyde dehydrogenase [Micractinium conductrix]
MSVVASASAEASAAGSEGSASARAAAKASSLIQQCISLPAKGGACPEECQAMADEIGADCVGAFVGALSQLDLEALGFSTGPRLAGVAQACGWEVPQDASAPAARQQRPGRPATSDAELARLQQSFADACDDEALDAVTSATAQAGVEVSAAGGTGAAGEAQAVERIPLAACFRFWSRSGGTDCPSECQQMADTLGTECTAALVEVVGAVSAEQLPGAPPTALLAEACGW